MVVLRFEFFLIPLLISNIVWALDPNVPPGSNFDLSEWTLQLPTGPEQGKMDMVSGKELAFGFTNTYFYTDKDDGSMVLMDPTTGVTSSGSLHCRTELREVTSGWSHLGKVNKLSATLSVPVLPNKTCVAQIFQATGPSKPLCELQVTKYSNGDNGIYLMLENTNEGGSSTNNKIGGIPGGSIFLFVLSLTGTTISLTINDVPTEFALPPTFEGETFYFKVGNYDQTSTAGTPGTEPGTVVKIYELNIEHAP